MKKKKWFTRWCKRCEGLYKTLQNFSTVCGDCDHGRTFRLHKRRAELGEATLIKTGR